MPRTKAVKKKAPQKLSKFAQEVLPILQNNFKAAKDKWEDEKTIFLRNLSAQLAKTKLSIPGNIINKTVGELSELPLNWSGSSTNATVQILDATKSLNETKRKQVERSSSFQDDGYLTSESSKSTSGGRQSRLRGRTQIKTKRISKSASSRLKSADRYVTPMHNNKIPPATYGTVTPKVKPNTPQVLLRRPNVGEVALSLQGSPLLTGNVVADHVANINIPLDGGKLLSIQPQRGLRISQIPEFDPETRRQLETLRDNLNKVCAISCKR